MNRLHSRRSHHPEESHKNYCQMLYRKLVIRVPPALINSLRLIDLPFLTLAIAKTPTPSSLKWEYIFMHIRAIASRYFPPSRIVHGHSDPSLTPSDTNATYMPVKNRDWYCMISILNDYSRKILRGDFRVRWTRAWLARCVFLAAPNLLATSALLVKNGTPYKERKHTRIHALERRWEQCRESVSSS